MLLLFLFSKRVINKEMVIIISIKIFNLTKLEANINKYIKIEKIRLLKFFLKNNIEIDDKNK